MTEMCNQSVLVRLTSEKVTCSILIESKLAQLCGKLHEGCETVHCDTEQKGRWCLIVMLMPVADIQGTAYRVL